MTGIARRARASVVGAFAVVLMLAALDQPARAADTLTDLGTLPGGIYGFPGGINAAGRIAGGADTSDGAIFRAFLWDETTGLQNIGTLGGDAFGNAINEAGEVVGHSALAQTGAGRFRDHAFRWTQSGGMQDLDTRLDTTSISRAYGISGLGQIVGEWNVLENGVLVFRAFRWTSTAGMQSLGTLPAGGSSIAYSVNDAGQVVGQANDATGSRRAFLWTEGGGMQDLGTLPGDTSAVARAINGAGQAVGWSEVPGVARQAFLWDAVGGMRSLGTLPGGLASQAYGINDAGQVVGGAMLGDGSFHAVLWDAAGNIRDLGLLPGGNFSVAYGINGAGQIVGQATNADGYDHAVRWQLNRPPVADALALTTPQDSAVAFTVTGSDPDGEPVTFALVAGPGNGTLTGSLPAVIYTPAPGFSGTDSFTFQVSDGFASSAVATVSITVTPKVEDPPPPPLDDDLDGRMNGQGGVDVNGNRHQFEFRVRTAAVGEEGYGKLEYTVPGAWFVSTATLGATFADDPASTPSRKPQPIVDSVAFWGMGTWNGEYGYRFEVRATDAGEPGPGHDSFALTITSPSGEVVASVDGLLSAGNIQSRRPKPAPTTARAGR